MAKRRTQRSTGTSAPAAQPTSTPATVQTLAIKTYLPPDGTPEIFIDGVAGVVVLNGVAKFRCFSAGTDPNDQAAATVVLRLAMGLPVVASIYELLGRMINDLKIPTALPAAQVD